MTAAAHNSPSPSITTLTPPDCIIILDPILLPFPFASASSATVCPSCADPLAQSRLNLSLVARSASGERGALSTNRIQQIPRLPPVLTSTLLSCVSIRPYVENWRWIWSGVVDPGNPVTRIADGGGGGAGPVDCRSHYRRRSISHTYSRPYQTVSATHLVGHDRQRLHDPIPTLITPACTSGLVCSRIHDHLQILTVVPPNDLLPPLDRRRIERRIVHHAEITCAQRFEEVWRDVGLWQGGSRMVRQGVGGSLGRVLAMRRRDWREGRHGTWGVA